MNFFMTRALLVATALAATSMTLAAPPAGVVVENVASGWNELVGVVELPDARLIAWERAGRVWMVDANGVKHSTPLIDISDEVLAHVDYGLLGLALDPHFDSNGHIYLAYVVDRHHLDFFGTPSYNPATTITEAATIARVTRYTAEAKDNFEHVHEESRHVVLGETREDGIPILHQSHGIGSLAFGTDHTLMVSAGESANFGSFDTGGQVPGGFLNDAIASGILPPEHDVGAFRSQIVDSLNGKVLRIDAETGAGVPSNPHYDPKEPRAPRSRVWSIGLRNPFRMSHVPGTGSHQPSDGNPGQFIVSDVGWGTWEEVDLVDAPSLNFGWPLFEGQAFNLGYLSYNVFCYEAPNPMAGGSCPATFRYRELICQETLNAPPWINPCGFLRGIDGQTLNAPWGATYGGANSYYYLELLATNQSLIQWTFNLPTAGSYEFMVRYATPAGGGTCQLLVDGSPAGSIVLAATGAPTEWRTATATVSVGAGSHIVRIVGPPTFPSPSGAPTTAFIDSVRLGAAGSAAVIPTEVRRGMHRRPLIEWQHQSAVSRTSGWNGNAAVAVNVGAAGGATGNLFGGNCAIASAPIALPSWPEAWRDRVWIADYAFGWVRAARLEGGTITDVDEFDQLSDGLVGIFPSFNQDALYVVDITGGLKRYRWAPGGNQAPVLVVSTSTPYGPGPHSVEFDATRSSDANGDRLETTWEFDDGSPPEVGPTMTHEFAGTGEPAVHHVVVTVSDMHGGEDSQLISVWTDNTPPAVDITSLQDGQLYPMDANTVFPLEAAVLDAEHANGVTCEWRTVLHHNTHSHPEPPDQQCDSTTVVSPLGCGEDDFWVTVQLTATDPLGLAASDMVTLLPDCRGALDCDADFNGDGVVDGADLGALLGAWGTTGAQDLNKDGTVDGADLGALLGVWGPCP